MYHTCFALFGNMTKNLICMFMQILLSFLCYFLKNKSNLLETHASMSKDTFHTWDYTQTLSAFSCGTTKQVKWMCCSIASMINSTLEFRSIFIFESCYTLVWAEDGSYISGCITSLFLNSKNTTVTVYLLETSLAWFKKCPKVVKNVLWLKD